MTHEQITNNLQKALELIDETQLQYILSFTDKQSINFFSNCSVKDCSILLYSLCRQSEEFKNALMAAFYQLQKDKDAGAPIAIGKMAQA